MLLSGGIDSATALSLMEGGPTRALTFDYHGIAKMELDSAGRVASWAGVKEHRVIRVPDLREAADIEGGTFPGLPPTYIPMRNSIFYSFAASYAEESGASVIVGGHNLDDASLFRDVSADFFGPLEKALRAGSRALDDRRLTIARPLAQMRKDEVVKLASERGVPLEATWSCHRDGDSHCGQCPGCLSRREAFVKAGVEDPLAVGGRAKIT